MPIPTKKDNQDQQPRERLCPLTSFAVPVQQPSKLIGGQPEIGFAVQMNTCIKDRCMFFNIENGMCILWDIRDMLVDVANGMDAVTGSVAILAGEKGAPAETDVPEPEKH